MHEECVSSLVILLIILIADSTKTIQNLRKLPYFLHYDENLPMFSSQGFKSISP